MPDRTLAEQLASFATRSECDRLPAEVTASVRQRVLDVLGICVAATPLDTSAAARGWALDQGGNSQAFAVGVSNPVPATVAAFVNGVLAHSLDYDDTHLPSVLHPSACIVPAALAAGQYAGADGASVVAAIAVGLEICVRLGMAGYSRDQRNSLFFEYGQHATSICGAVAAAVSAGMLMSLDTAGLVSAMGVAASMASGVIEANRSGGSVKRLHCGWAAHSAVCAAQLTAREGRFGFFQAWLRGDFDPSAITDGLGSRWAVPGIFFKPYPANHFTHAAIDAAIELRTAGLRPGDVESAVLGVALPAWRTIGDPIEVKRAPQTGYMAQFSGPYAVAAGLFGGGGLGVSLADFTDELALDPARRELMGRISVVADERCTGIFPDQFPAVLRVRTKDGRDLAAEVLTNRGGPQRPLSLAELETKFQDNVAGLLPAGAAAQVKQAVAGLGQLPDLDAVLRPLMHAGTTEVAS
jgi:2-methylcitrate dehydratase PrpD